MFLRRRLPFRPLEPAQTVDDLKEILRDTFEILQTNQRAIMDQIAGKQRLLGPNWRIIVVGDNVEIQNLVNGVWTYKGRWIP